MNKLFSNKNVFVFLMLVYLAFGLLMSFCMLGKDNVEEESGAFIKILQIYTIGVVIFAAISFLIKRRRAKTVKAEIFNILGIVWILCGIILCFLLLTKIYQNLTIISIYAICSICIALLLLVKRQIDE